MKITQLRSDFAQVPNSPLFDKKLSWKAKGIFAYIQAKPNDYDFDSNRMSTEAKDGVDGTRSAIKELLDCGYLKRRRLPSGKMEYVLQLPTEPQREIPSEGKTHRGKSPRLINTDSKQIQSNTNNTGEHSPPFVWNEYLDVMKKDKQRHIQIIGVFFKVKKTMFTSKEQVETAIARHAKAARQLISFEDEKLIETMQRLNYEWPKFTLETVMKELTK